MKRKVHSWIFVAQGAGTTRKERSAAILKAKRSKGQWASGTSKNGVKWCVFPTFMSKVTR